MFSRFLNKNMFSLNDSKIGDDSEYNGTCLRQMLCFSAITYAVPSAYLQEIFGGFSCRARCCFNVSCIYK